MQEVLFRANFISWAEPDNSLWLDIVYISLQKAFLLLPAFLKEQFAVLWI